MREHPAACPVASGQPVSGAPEAVPAWGGDERARRIIDTAPDAFLGMDGRGLVTDWNPAAEAMFGYSRADVLGRRLSELVIPPADRAAHEAGVRRFNHSGSGAMVGHPVQVNALHRDGREFPVDLTIWPLRQHGGWSFYAFLRDVSDRVAAEEAGQLASIVTASPDAIFSVDVDAKVRAWNPGAERMYGYTAGQMLGTSMSRLVPAEREAEFRWILDQVSAGQEVRLETVRVRADGVRLQVSLSVSPVLDARGDVVRLAFVARDVTAAKAAERHLRETRDALARQAEEMEHRAFHDPLTGLANRALLADRLGHALMQAEHTGSLVTLLMIDIDDFKDVNDSLGHTFGDRLVCQVADRLRAALRAGDTVARLGGDEFAVLIEQAGAGEGASTAARIGDVMAPPVVLSGHPVSVRASVGVAESADMSATSTEEMLRNADLAMYAAKNSGKAGWRMYRSDLHTEVANRVRLESDLRDALTEGQYVVYYQPICCPHSGRTHTVEALLRWQHPDRGLVPPGEFVPALEQTGLIVDVGAWVLQEACAVAARLRAIGHDVVVSVNLSIRQLSDPHLLRTIEEALAAHDLPSDRLTLEITETLLIGSIEDASTRLLELRRLGVGLAVDDFGTGHSSLGRLRSLPVTSLKVDRSFIREISANPTDHTIIEAVVAMAHGLGLPVVAEGVETLTQLHGLRELGCDAVQGYLFAPPMPAAELRRHLAGQSSVGQADAPRTTPAA